MISKDKLQEKSSSIADIYAFSDVVDRACEGLMDRKIKYSIRRIQEMDEYLCGLEQELDAFLGLRTESVSKMEI